MMLKDFEEALRILEGSFIVIEGGKVSFVNPSLRDYLSEYLDNADLLEEFAASAQSARWASALWEHVRIKQVMPPAEQSRIAKAFAKLAEAFIRLPVMTRDPREPNVYHYSDTSNTGRITMVLQWWSACQEGRLADAALALARNPHGGFSPWRDGTELVRIIRELRDPNEDSGFPHSEEMAGVLEDRLVKLLESGVGLDDLEKIYDAIEESKNVFDESVPDAALRAVEYEIDNIESNLESIDSESTLEDHISTIEKLAPRTGLPSYHVTAAIAKVKSRIDELNAFVSEASSPQVRGSGKQADAFDDAALANLFAPLVSTVT